MVISHECTKTPECFDPVVTFTAAILRDQEHETTYVLPIQTLLTYPVLLEFLKILASLYSK